MIATSWMGATPTAMRVLPGPSWDGTTVRGSTGPSSGWCEQCRDPRRPRSSMLKNTFFSTAVKVTCGSMVNYSRVQIIICEATDHSRTSPLCVSVLLIGPNYQSRKLRVSHGVFDRVLTSPPRTLREGSSKSGYVRLCGFLSGTLADMIVGAGLESLLIGRGRRG